MAGNGQYQMGSSPYVQFMPINVTTERGIVKVTTVYRSVVLARVGLGIFTLCIFSFCLRSKESCRAELRVVKPQKRLDNLIE